MAHKFTQKSWVQCLTFSGWGPASVKNVWGQQKVCLKNAKKTCESVGSQHITFDFKKTSWLHKSWSECVETNTVLQHGLLLSHRVTLEKSLTHTSWELGGKHLQSLNSVWHMQKTWDYTEILIAYHETNTDKRTKKQSIAAISHGPRILGDSCMPQGTMDHFDHGATSPNYEIDQKYLELKVKLSEHASTWGNLSFPRTRITSLKMPHLQAELI